MGRANTSLTTKNRLLISILAAILALGLAEFGARYWLFNSASRDKLRQFAHYDEIPPEKRQLSPHPYLNYFPTPDYDDGQTYHNEWGFRGDDFPLEKPDGEFRIVLLGGSTTYTSAIPENADTFPALLENRLREQYGHQRIRVINAGVPGYSSWESLINFEFRVLEIDPDLIVVYHGTNDAHARIVSPEAYRGDNTGKVRQWQAPAKNWIERSILLRIATRLLGWTSPQGVGSFVDAPTYLAPAIISRTYDDTARLETYFPEPLLTANPPHFFQRNLENIAYLAFNHGVEVVFATWAFSPGFDDYASTDFYQAAFTQQNEIVRSLAGIPGVGVYDFAAEMPTSTQYWADGRHVNEAGAVVKADLFANYLEGAGLFNR